ncbi:N-acetylgalactosamine-4-sulfatase [Candidatus Poribacteria bacterium]|nr:N-acetylgalactosamine-4-sulfatase [Candidatus Poribacteria bacterium]OUT58868.1 MAG: N-acetylgalactosamine-4-sulfatase [bacterium TMED15]
MNQRPNVVFIITDDQGYGDLACHGNPIINTPHLDQLHAKSTRLTNFHVGPTCAPTRAGIMTGRYCNCTGVWHTIGGRSLLRNDETTMADIFRANGYRTGMFGKWHLGDNYPFRPHNRGFDEALYHGGGGISQTPDYWGNDYFDDTYWRNGVEESFEGYCTDIWFEQATKFIHKHRDQPFFCYIPTNAPHGPFRVPQKYAAPYIDQQVPESRANFYGMITNIDENIGRLRQELEQLEIADNTIFIFMTDNGSAEGCQLDQDQFVINGFNAGMRGKKGSEYEGGHRVPIFLHWPNGGHTSGNEIDDLTANIDLLPTLIDLCNVDPPETADFHGISLASRLRFEINQLTERVIVTDSQRVERPIKWKQSATMNQRWRLINGRELYDILLDPEQRQDLADQHPEVVQDLCQHYENWWDLVSPRFDEDCPIIVGSDQEQISLLTSHDWHGQQHAWNQGQIRQGLVSNGYWAVDFAHDGEYHFELRRWPKEEDRRLTEGIPGDKIDLYNGGKALELQSATIKIGEYQQTQTISTSDKSVSFTFQLSAGETRLQTYLTDSGGLTIGAYYVYASRI